MYNLLEDNENYSMTGSLWNYYRDKIAYVNENASDGKSFKYQTKIIGITEARPAAPPATPEGGDWPPRPPLPPLNTEVTIPLKYLSNFGDLLVYLLLIVN